MPNNRKVTATDALRIALANPDIAVPPEALGLLQRVKRNKYGNIKTDFAGLRFDSKAEMRRYSLLRYRELAGEISALECQPVFQLAGNVKYRADFRYIEDDRVIVEDVKGVETAAFRIKWKQAIERYPDIEFRLIKK